MKKIKLIAVIILTMGFMSLMFYFSSQDGTVSHTLSKGIVRYIKDLSPALTAFKDHGPGRYLVFDFLLRKTVHFTEFFVLSLLIFSAARLFKLDENKARILAVAISFLFSISDELHQLFVIGRTPTIYDILIDTSGSIAAMLLVLYAQKKKNRKGRMENRDG